MRDEEGCLSFPDIVEIVERPEAVAVEAYDEKGVKRVLEGTRPPRPRLLPRDRPPRLAPLHRADVEPEEGARPAQGRQAPEARRVVEPRRRRRGRLRGEPPRALRIQCGAAERLDQVGPVERPGEVPGEGDEVLELGRVARRGEPAAAVDAKRPEELGPDPQGGRDDDPVSGGVAHLARKARGLLDARVLGEGEGGEVGRAAPRPATWGRGASGSPAGRAGGSGASTPSAPKSWAIRSRIGPSAAARFSSGPASSASSLSVISCCSSRKRVRAPSVSRRSWSEGRSSSAPSARARRTASSGSRSRAPRSPSGGPPPRSAPSRRGPACRPSPGAS